jgi:predicted unusual protein kinase regulating ubiquinone biosynthesis (AarF/ABC1/UbiB family)
MRAYLRQLSRLARTLGPMVPGIDVKPLVDELRARAVEELDYRLEAESQHAFAIAYADDPDIVVPDVVAHGEHVLVTQWLESPASLASVIATGDEAERNHYAGRYAQFLFGSPSRTGMLHADPHPGNFRIVPGPDGGLGRMGVLDYGAVARLPERGLPRALGALIRIAAMDNYDELVDHLRSEGFIRDRIRVDADQLRSYLGPFIEPASQETFRFSRTWMRQQFRRLNDPRKDDYATMLRLNLPPEYLLIHRTWTGAVGVLSQLEAELPFRTLLEEHLPGFAG